MAYNTGTQKHKSTYLEGLDCGYNLKAVPQDDNFPDAIFTASATRVVGVGECVAMIRVAANTVILGAELYWDDAVPATVVAVGDPFACARLLGAIHTGAARGTISSSFATCSPWGLCGTLMKIGREGDGCGVFYRYTCETDINLTNLDGDARAAMGGWAGGGAGAKGSQVGAAITAGTFTLVLHTKKATSIS